MGNLGLNKAITYYLLSITYYLLPINDESPVHSKYDPN